MVHSGTGHYRNQSHCRRNRTRCSTVQIWAGTRPSDFGYRRDRRYCKGWGLRHRCLLDNFQDRNSLRLYRSYWQSRSTICFSRKGRGFSKHTSHQHRSSLPIDFRCRYWYNSVAPRTSRSSRRESVGRVLYPRSDKQRARGHRLKHVQTNPMRYNTCYLGQSWSNRHRCSGCLP